MIVFISRIKLWFFLPSEGTKSCSPFRITQNRGVAIDPDALNGPQRGWWQCSLALPRSGPAYLPAPSNVCKRAWMWVLVRPVMHCSLNVASIFCWTVKYYHRDEIVIIMTFFTWCLRDSQYAQHKPFHSSIRLKLVKTRVLLRTLNVGYVLWVKCACKCVRLCVCIICVCFWMSVRICVWTPLRVCTACRDW